MTFFAHKLAKMRAQEQNKKRDRSFYLRQNKTIHLARSQLNMSIDECRELARSISGTASISSLSLRQRHELINRLKEKGAKVYNPPLPAEELAGQDVGISDGVPPGKTYQRRLAYWNKRFPKHRPGFASNRQLAWIQTLWELDFNDGRAGSALRGLILI